MYMLITYSIHISQDSQAISLPIYQLSDNNDDYSNSCQVNENADPVPSTDMMR